MAQPIYFYAKTDAYYELSNFAPYGFEADGVYWPSVEHYYQAQKFAGPEYAAFRERIRGSRTPGEAKKLGRTRQVPIRDDWDRVRDAIMLHALRLKFRHPSLRQLLLGTGRRPLVEASPYDGYWGAGPAGQGQNRLGQLLMQVRAELRSAR